MKHPDALQLAYRMILAHLQRDNAAMQFALAQVDEDDRPAELMVQTAQYLAALAARELSGRRATHEQAVALVAEWIRNTLDNQGSRQ